MLSLSKEVKVLGLMRREKSAEVAQLCGKNASSTCEVVKEEEKNLASFCRCASN